MPEELTYNVNDLQERQLQKYKMRKHSGQKLTLPTGMLIDATPFLNVRPPGADDTFVLSSPERYLRNPKPGCSYVWRLRTDERTIGLVEAHSLRPVTMDEIDRTETTSELASFSGPAGTKYVGWKRMALFEVSPQLTKKWFKDPVLWAGRKTLHIGDQFKEDVERATDGKMTGSFEKKDRASALEEAARG